MNELQRLSALSPLRYPVFRRVWLATTVSNVGALTQSVGAAWMMTSIAQSAAMVTLVQASVALPIVLLSLIAGAMADNMDRRKMMLRAQIFMLIVAGSWLWGVVASNDSIGAALLTASVVTLFGAVLERWLPLAQAEALDLAPLRVWKEPPGTAVPVEGRTGPGVPLLLVCGA